MSECSTRLEKEFRRYHRDNPQVLKALAKLCIRLYTKGLPADFLLGKLGSRNRLSVKMLYEIVRYQTLVKTKGQGKWQMPNAHTAYYAVLLMRIFPFIVFQTAKRSES
jgi:hypothetical protein